MIISLRIKNFYSIKEDSIIDFTADMTARKKRDSLPTNLIDFNGDKFVNVIGMFGSNAAGKSNIIKALSFCRNLVLTSHLNNEDTELDIEQFKFGEQARSEFYINFVSNGVEYEYEFHLDGGRIVYEELYHYPKKRKARVFRRTATGYSHRKGLIERPGEVEINTGSKTLFISRASSMNREIPLNIYRFFKNEIATNDDLCSPLYMNRTEFDNYRDVLLKALEVSDSDIVDLRLEELQPGTPKLTSFHKEDPSVPFDFDREESDGTKRLLLLLLLILRKAIGGATIFMDEFDLKLHLRLGEFLLDTVRATNRGQMVFTSHNPTLIDTTKLRPEQIVFVTKQADGNSEFIPLSDYEGLKKIPNIQQAYLQGRFDAVPYVGNIFPTLHQLINKS